MEVKVYGPYTHKGTGRKIVVVYDDSGKRKSMSYARFLLQESLGRELTGDETADHIDEDPTNDDLDNLQVLTPTENIEKARRSGKVAGNAKLIEFGKSEASREASRRRLLTANPSSKLTQAEVIEIRRAFATGEMTIASICVAYSITRRSIKHLLIGKTYPHFEGPLVARLKWGQE
jgi:hypothetical protein